jgi:hypothetical protein
MHTSSDYVAMDLAIKLIDDMASSDDWYTKQALADKYNTTIRTINRLLARIKRLEPVLTNTRIDYKKDAFQGGETTVVRVRTLRGNRG